MFFVILYDRENKGASLTIKFPSPPRAFHHVYEKRAFVSVSVLICVCIYVHIHSVYLEFTCLCLCAFVCSLACVPVFSLMERSKQPLMIPSLRHTPRIPSRHTNSSVLHCQVIFLCVLEITRVCIECETDMMYLCALA